MIRFWLFASRPRILLPKTQVLQYLTNYVRILDQADDLHLRAASWTGQRINLPNLFEAKRTPVTCLYIFIKIIY